jgi:hypothetical protein
MPKIFDPLDNKGSEVFDPMDKGAIQPEKDTLLSRVSKGAWQDITDIVTAPSIIKSLGGLLEGGIETVVRAIQPSGPDYPPSEKAQAFGMAIEPIKESIRNPSGIPGRVLDYSIDHPVKQIMNLSGAASLAGKTTGISALSTAGRVTNPIEMGMEAVKLTGKKVIAPILGSRPLTGVETESILRAAKGSPEFQKGMRGKVIPEEIFNEANSALGQIKTDRGNRYRVELNAIKTMPNPPTMDLIQPLQKFSDSIKEHGILLKRNSQTGELKLDFSKSALLNNSVAQRDLTSLLDTMRNSFKDPKFYSSPEGFDILKRQVAEMYSESHQGRAVIEGVSDSIRKQLVDKVPRYRDMVKDYEKTSTLIKEIKSDLSLGKKEATQSAIRRVLSSVRDNNDFRKSLIEKLPGGEAMLDQIAGYGMKGIIPTQHGGTQLAAAEILAAAIGGNPKVLFGVLAGSPRLVAETLNTMGKAINIYRKNKVPSPASIGRGVVIGSQIKSGSSEE